MVSLGSLVLSCTAQPTVAQAEPATIRLDLPLAAVRTAGPETSTAAPAAGGPENKRLVVQVDPALLRRVILTPEDFREAALRLPITQLTGDATGATLDLHRLLKAPVGGALAAGVDYEARPMASAPLPAATGVLRVPGLAAALREMAARGGYGFVAAVRSTGASRPLMTLPATPGREPAAQPALEVTLVKHPNALLFDHEIKPRPGVFTEMRHGHLYYGDRRLRLWGLVGYGTADRMRKMGFNAQRVWEPTSQTGGGSSEIGARNFYTAESAKRGEPAPYTKEDGSRIDRADRHFADLKAHGMFVMFAALSGTLPIEPLLADDSFIAGGSDWTEWKKAMTQVKDRAAMARIAIFFDERLQRMKKRHAANLLGHVNQYTGKKYGEDEAIAVYEIWNENGFIKRVLDRGLDDLPAFFHGQAQRQWNDWLRARYKDDAGLRKAWSAFKDGENIQAGTVKLAPIVAQRADYPAARAADFVRFLTEKADGFHQDFRSFCRAQAPKGVGVNVAPFSFDTQYRPSIHWPYTSAQGDVNSFGMYFWDLKSQLSRPPSMYVIDSHTVEGKATILYETNQGRPGSHRAEYPLRLAALASWQDWDGVFWHYWAGGNVERDEEFLAQPMPYISPSHFWTAVQHERDPVMTSAMAIAGRIFLGGAIQPAPEPATYTVGKEGIFSFSHVNGIGQARATFSRGSRIRFEPEGEFDVRTAAADQPPTDGAVAAGDQILWDYPNGRLIIDTPTAKVYVGRTAPSYRFKDGLTLSGFTTPFVAWAMVSADGRPLTGSNAAERVFIAANADARNTGFVFDEASAGGPPLEQAKSIRSWGRAPVVVDRADFTLSLPFLADYTFSGYDFALRRGVASSAKDSNILRMRQETPPWMGVLEINRRGAAAQPVVDASDIRLGAAAGPTGGGGGDARLTGIYNPLPGVSWGDTYAEAHKTLRDGAYRRTGISPEDTSSRPVKTITVTEAQILLDTPADIDVLFAGGRMHRIVATFRRPPVLREAAATLEKRFGRPLESRITGDQTREDRVRWRVRAPAADLEVALTESQGTVSLIYTLHPKETRP